MQHDLFDKRVSAAQHAMLKRITDALANMGCKYLIKTPDGEMLSLGMKAATSGNAAPAAPAAPVHAVKRAPLKHAYGAKRAYVRPYLENLKTGEVAVIPFHSQFTPAEVQNAACNLAASLWGNGTYTSAIDDNRRVIELLRTDGI